MLQSQRNSANFTNILFYILFQVALDKSKPNQISFRESCYADNLKVCEEKQTSLWFSHIQNQ